MSHRKGPKPHANLRTKIRFVNLKALKMEGKNRWWKHIAPWNKQVNWNI